LNHRVLVLNRSWTAVHVANVRRAISLVFRDLARIVDPETYATHDFPSWISTTALHHTDARSDRGNGHDQTPGNGNGNGRVSGNGHGKTNGYRYIHTPTMAVRVPDVIQLVEYNRIPRQEVQLSRRSIYERDKGTCQYCGRRVPISEYTMDHVLPRSRGGVTSWENIVVSCARCNARKGDRTPAEARMSLQSVPVKPKWATPLGIRLGQRMNASWKKFLHKNYWGKETA
jgi:5-methylcytosine-specific restriction endonuclease McrA